MWELDHKESWVPNNWCFWTVVLQKTPESPLDSKEIQPIHPKGNQHWIFIGKTDAEAEAPVPWYSDAKNWFIGKDHDAEKDWRQEKGTTEDEMVGWHPRLDAHEFVQSPGIGEGQRSLACCSPWGHKGSEMTEPLNWTEYNVNAMCMPAVLQLSPTLCDPMDCSPPGSSVHGILQAIILEWVAISSPRGFCQPRDKTQVSCGSCIGRQVLYH